MYSQASDKYSQLSFFFKPLFEQLDEKNKYILLFNMINWSLLIEKLKVFFADCGRIALPLRLMVGLLIVKYVENISDERVIELYRENPYIQYFCGRTEFTNEAPCSSATLSNFRTRIGEEGCKAIFSASVAIHNLPKEEIDVSTVIVDTTVQCKNITYPTDVKLLVKVICLCQNIAKKNGIHLKNTYKGQVKELLKIVRFENSKKVEKLKEIRKAKKRIFTIAGILFRELNRELSADELQRREEQFKIFKRVIDQSRKTASIATILKEKIETLLSQFENCKGILSQYNIDISKRTNNNVENISDAYKNAKGRGMQKVLQDSYKSIRSTIINLVRKIEKKLDENQLLEVKEKLITIKDTLHETDGSNRIYSIHEPHVACITKGKAGVKHEYGSKASIAITKYSAIIVGVHSFQGNPHDSNTLNETIKSVVETTGVNPENCLADRGYRGAQDKNPDVNVLLPSNPTSDASDEEKAAARANFKRRSSVEPVIGHVKDDFRLRRNFLKGDLGDSINLLLACSAFNFKKWMRKKFGEISISLQKSLS